MCGIIGYTGPDQVLDQLVAGLGTLEYRGYDSAGVVVVSGTAAAPQLRAVKRSGKLAALRQALEGQHIPGSCGLGHTRWATHGEPSDRNAHPHFDQAGNLAVIHNGIIENFTQLRAELAEQGHEFASETDTEVLAHLIGACYPGNGQAGEDPDGGEARSGREDARGDAPSGRADVRGGGPSGRADARGGASSGGEDAENDGLGTGAELADAVRAAMRRVEGAFALAVVDARHPDVIVAARRHAPLVVGHADGASLLSSDVAGLIEHTRDVEALLDDQIAILTPGTILITDLDGNPVDGHRFKVDWDVAAAAKQGFPHFMLKEIHEQPTAIRETLLGRLDAGGRLQLDEFDIDPSELRHIDKVYVVACGTSYHAGMVAKYAVEHWAGVGVEVEIASEFRYRDPILTPHTLVVAISQSGETADTIAAAAHARDQRAKVVAVTNVVGSTLAREADAVLYTRAGPEIAVASTKAFTTQLIALYVLALFLAQERRSLFPDECRDQLARLEALPELLTQVLDQEPQLAELARRFARADYFMFIGRHVGLPIALEGALKLKEISYLHAEGFPSGEMKHGPIALIDDGGPVIALVTRGHVRAKILANVAEVKARGAVVLAIATEGDTEIKEHADHVIYVPDVHELLYPVLTVVPLQTLAYHIATELGRDVDQPRNLAKTVTVE